MSELKLKHLTTVDMVLGLEKQTTLGARFLNNIGQETFYPYADIANRAKAAAGFLQAAGLQKGDRVAIVLPTSVEFMDAFLGTQLAGGIPAALYPPFRLGKLDEYFTRLRRMMNKMGARFLITDARISRLLGTGVTGVSSLKDVIDATNLKKGSGWKQVAVDAEDIAFLQFSSGTTVEPKAVSVSHSNLMHNLSMMEAGIGGGTPEEFAGGGVCWLPLYHDMGLVGCLYLGLHYPGTMTYMGPESFIGRPAMWLQTISKYRGVVSPAPHFAYGLCLKKVRDEDMEGVDLSSWRAALNGAEPIDVETMERFCERFARWGFKREAMKPVYGLAEAGLGVSFSAMDEAPVVTEFDRAALSGEGKAIRGEGRKLPSVGKAMVGLSVEIQDENGNAVAEGLAGRIMIKGPSVTKGYFNDPELNETMIRNGWMDTGDIGFFFEGNLYIGGRAKDLIIIRGRNYAPQEMEELLLDIAGLRTGCAVALGIQVEGSGEDLLILAELDSMSKRPEEEVLAEIRNRLLTGLSLAPYHIELLPPGTLPRTSSGKLRRSDALKKYVAGELVPPDKVTALKLLKEIGKSQIAWARFALTKGGK
ncbi:MAG: fatty acyl-AMP ligase [Bryobacteraceae bacterium]